MSRENLTIGNGSMSIYKTFQGAWCISAIINGYRVSRQYFFYTKREAIALFKAEVQS